MQLQNSTKDQLRAIVARIERLEEEKAALAADLREVYAEAKGNGFDVKALRAVIASASRMRTSGGRRWRCSTPISMRSAWQRPRPPDALNGIVMPGLDPGIQGPRAWRPLLWIAGSSPAMT